MSQMKKEIAVPTWSLLSAEVASKGFYLLHALLDLELSFHIDTDIRKFSYIDFRLNFLEVWKYRDTFSSPSS